MKVCHNCGKESVDETRFCDQCGAPFSPESPVPPQYHQAANAPLPARKTSIWLWVAILAGAFVCICPVLLVLAAILFPVFSQARQAAQRTVALSNSKQAALAMKMYANDFDDLFPYVQNTPSAIDVLQHYVSTRTIFNSPIEGGTFEFNLNIAGVKSSDIPLQASVPMWTERIPDAKIRPAVSFVDGHARLITPGMLPELEKAAAQRFPRPKNSKPIGVGP
ncbi:MAG: zinc-ribbon domain-containing protein [Fimbriimonas sp.]|nr:zinc-ribbon domain-containing protein [Fimbriimonas sp.]